METVWKESGDGFAVEGGPGVPSVRISVEKTFTVSSFFDRLWLGNNHLSFVPDCIGQLTNLTRYDIRFVQYLISILISLFDRLALNDNDLKLLPHSMGNLKKLKK